MSISRVITFGSFHVGYTLLYRLWLIASGAVAIVCVPFWFSTVDQGYFYTFSSLVGAQVLFELGTGFVITQLAAHERALAGGEGKLAVEPMDRVALILGFSDRWFRRAAGLFLALVGGFGWLFFTLTGSLPMTEWGGPWILIVVASAGGLRLVPTLALLEGLGEIGEVARLRLMQSVAGNLVMWVLLFLGARLWALFVVPGVAFGFTLVWIRRHTVISDLKRRLARGIDAVLDWRREVLPLQWRIALSWASGYLVFQAITPVAFAKLGSVAAGQIGLGLAIFNGVQSIGNSWMYTRMPRYAELVARNERQGLNVLFVATLKWTVAIVGVGVVLVLMGTTILDQIAPKLAGRLPPTPAMACLAIASLVNSVIFSLALYMRCHKEEPMLAASVVGGLITFLGVLAVAPHGLLATTLTYMLITSCVGMPWAWLLFKPYYNR